MLGTARLEEPDAAVVRGRPSGGSQIFLEEELFARLLDLEVQKATRLGYCVSVFCLTPDLPAGEAEPGLTRRLAELAMGRLRATDVAATVGPSCLAILLVDAEVEALPGIFGRLREELEAHRVPVGGRWRRVTVVAGGGCYPRTASSAGELLGQAVDLMIQAKREGGNRFYLPS